MRQLILRDGQPDTDGADDLSHSHARLALTNILANAIGEIPADLQSAANAMFGLGDATQPALGDRQQELATTIGVDIRTIRRRCDDAVQLIAERLLQDPIDSSRPGILEKSNGTNEIQRREKVFVAGNWYTEKFSALLRVDVATPSCREERTVVALVNGVSQVTASTGLLVVSTSESTTPISATEYGARLIRTDDYPGGVAIAHFKIPQELKVNERYTYGRIVSLDEGQQLLPRYIFAPGNRCDEFLLRVRFDELNPPSTIWVNAGVPYRVADAETPGSDRIELDSIGEVRLRFTDLRMGSCYGIGWTPSDSS